MPDELQLVPGTLASNCYPAAPQTLYNEMFAKGVALLGTLGKGFVVSETEPAPADRDKIWVQIDANGFVVPHGLWRYGGGIWHWPHEVTTTSIERRFVEGDAAAVQLYDGGTAVAVGDATGPFWEIDANYAGRSPMGAGTIPDTTTVLAVSANFGSGQHTMTLAELVSHTHVVSTPQRTRFKTDSGGPPLFGDLDPSAAYSLTSEATGSTTPFSMVHPVRGGNWIKRTARRFRTP